jgi:predicted permease
MSLLSRFRGLWKRDQLERDIDDELRAHLEMRAEDSVRAGMSERDARDDAQRRFGSSTLLKEETRERDLFRWLETFAQDLRYGVRMLRRSPGFTAAVVLTLALGIGANTAIFTLIDAVMLKSLPVKDPQEVVVLQWVDPPVRDRLAPQWSRWMDGESWDENGRDVGTSFSYPAFEQIRAHNRVFSGIFAFADLGDHMNIVADGEPGLAHGQLASSGIFDTLEIRPVAGRLFIDSDDRTGAPPVCVISAGYWKRRFGGDPRIAGKHVTLAGVPFTIVGVTPQNFFGLQTGSVVDIWVPISTQPLVYPDLDRKVSLFTSPKHWWVLLMGRLKPGVSVAEATADLDVIFRPVAAVGLVPRNGTPPALPSVELAPGGGGLGELRRKFSRPLFVLMGLVGLVLLIACANVASLLVTRASSRRREIGVRLALGASRGRLIRQLLTESLLLAGLGGACGCVLAVWASAFLVTLSSAGRGVFTLTLNPDLRILAFTAAASFVTGILFGLIPASRATRLELTPALKQNAQEFHGAGLRFGLGKALVVAQVALSLVLLFGAGLFVRTLVNLRHLDIGFNQQNVLLFGLNPTKSGYKEAALNDFYSRVQQRLSALPGVTSATSSWHLLLEGGARGLTISVPGYVPKSGERMSLHVLPVGPGFFATMKIPLLRGRDFTERDHERAPKVVAVNESFAKKYFAGRDPLGQRIILAPDEEEYRSDAEIVGLTKDARYDSLRGATPPTIYQPVRQATDIPYLFFELRTAANPLALVPSVRAAVASIDASVPLFGIKTQSQQIDELLFQERLFAKLTSSFGFLALLLACVGLFGILSYAVARRTREIGIRMALGAQQADVLRMVMRETLLLVAVGIAFGVLASVAASRIASSVISDLLYGLKITDASTIIISGGLLILVALFAGFLPAHRASQVDPNIALRYE